MDDFKEFDELTAKWDGQARASAKAFITKHYLKKSVVRELLEKKRMTMRAALETGSDAGAGYTIGYNSALDDILKELS